jgi:Phosphotransferase enzyme family
VTEHLLDVLSRSRRAPSIAGNSIDTKVIRLSQLRAEGGTAVAVVKVARDPWGATQLRTQHRLVAQVASQPGLDMAWRGLVPRVLAFDERPDATVCVETYRPGVQLAEVLDGDPSRLEELIVVALSAIAPLHRATTRPIVVDNLSAIRQWVVDPVSDVARVCGQVDPGLLPGLERLEATLTRALVGRRMTVCWTHGDYTPESVYLAGPRGQVNRIVGWDKAREDRPALIDSHLVILAASAQVEGVELGTIVSRRLITGGLSDSERDALRAGGVDDSECIDGRAAILLAWLQHVAMLCRNGSELQKDAKLGPNVASVIDAVDAWHGSDAA